MTPDQFPAGRPPRLGASRATYTPQPEPWVGTVVAGVGLAFIVVLALATLAVPLIVCAAVLSAAYVPMTVGKIQATRRGVGARLELFERGLVFTDTDGRPFAFSYHSLTMLRRVVESHKNGTVRTWHAHTLAGPDGVAVTIGDGSAGSERHLGASTVVRGPAFADAEAWGRAIEQSVVEAQLPRAAKQLAAGGTVPFGPIGLHLDGPTVAGRTVPWSRVQHFRPVYNARFEIVEQGVRTPLIRQPTSVIPNFAVLYALGSRLHSVPR